MIAFVVSIQRRTPLHWSMCGKIRKCCRSFQFLLLHKKPSFVPSESGEFILGLKHAYINPYFHCLKEAMDLSLNTSKLIKRYNIQKPLRIFAHKRYCFWSMRMTYFTNTRFQNQNANWTNIHNRIDSGETFDDFRDTHTSSLVMFHHVTIIGFLTAISVDI
jgi:hypothetical protein